MAGDGEVGIRGDAAAAIHGHAKTGGERAGGDSGGPDDGRGLETGAVYEIKSTGADRSDAGVIPDLDAEFFEAFTGVEALLGIVGLEDEFGALDEDDAELAGIDPAEI